MNKKYFFIILILIQIILIKILLSQEVSILNQKSLLNIPFPRKELVEKFRQPSTTETMLISSINEDEYIVDSGDEFYIRVDVEGPEVKIINSQVSSDGFLTFDEAPFIYVRGKNLREVKKTIYNHLKSYYNNDKIDISLHRVHYIDISIIGSLNPVGEMRFTSANRLSDVIQYLLGLYQSDTTSANLIENISLRRIELIRGNHKQKYDILKYIRSKDNSQNPLLRSNDIIYIGFKNKDVGNIYIGGAIGCPGLYEYISGDSLGTIISLSGGLVPGADSSRIEIYRREGNKQLHYFLSINNKNFLLRPGDYIYTHSKRSQKPKQFVSVLGEVNYPGIYPIISGKTTLNDILNWCGGFTPYADIERGYIRRYGMRENWLNEVKRIQDSKGGEPLYTIDKSILKVNYRQNSDIVQIDFTKLDSVGQSFKLIGGDTIYVPSKSFTISLLGAIKYPGIYPYVKGFTIKDYIEIAGGFNKGALKRKIKLIDAKTNNWLEVGLHFEPKPNDKVFIPQKEEIDFWPLFKDILNITVQVGTVIIILRNLR